MTATTHLTDVATDVDVTELNGESIIDFDIDANTDYEIQSCMMTDDDGRVVEASVRFGRVEERPELGIGRSILLSAWQSMVRDTIGDVEGVKADLSDFDHIVPHLRIEREAVEEYGAETVTEREFAAAVAELATLVSNVLRGDDATIDAEIDQYL